jgi:D-3-phosphoglycerate dehydrogenase
MAMRLLTFPSFPSLKNFGTRMSLAALITPEAMRMTPIAAAAVECLQAAGFDVRYPHDPLLARGQASFSEMEAELEGIDAVIASSEPYTPELLERLPRLRVIARCGVGYDRVNVPAATRLGKAVTITPGANHEAVAELALALLFGVTKRIVVNDRLIRQGAWPREPLIPLRGRTLGILGLGRIGRSLATRAQALRMQVIAHEERPDTDFVQRQGIELVSFDELLQRSDYLSIHCPLTPATEGLFNTSVFARMKPGSVLINTARGKLVVETDLIAALESGHLSGAGLDVFEEEPPARSNRLLQLDQVVAAPHIAGADQLSMEAMGVEAADCIVRLQRNEWPEGAVVNAELKSTWRW